MRAQKECGAKLARAHLGLNPSTIPQLKKKKKKEEKKKLSTARCCTCRTGYTASDAPRILHMRISVTFNF